MKKYFSVKKIIMYLIIAWVLYSIYSYYFNTTTKTVTVTKEYTVATWSIENSIKVTGLAALVDEQKLKFNQVATVTKLYFKDWDNVKKGELLAELDKTDINSSIKQSELSLSDAQIKLADLLDWPKYKDVLNWENSVITAENRILTLENDLSILKNDTIPQYKYKFENDIKSFDNSIELKKTDVINNKNDIKNSESKLANMKNDLATLEKTEEKWLTDFSIDLNKTISDAYISAKKQIIDMENNLVDTDNILWVSVENRNVNDAYELYLWAKNPTTKVKAENDWRSAKALFDNAKTLYNWLNNTNQSATEIIDFLNKLLESYDNMTNLWKDWQEMMISSIASTTFTQSEIDSKASIFSSITNSSQSNYNGIKTTIANIQKLTDPELKKILSQNTINSKKQSIIDAELSLNKLKVDNVNKLRFDLEKLLSDKVYATRSYEAQITSYDSQIRQKTLDIESARNSLEYAKENLKIIKEWATTAELSQSRNNVAKAKLSLDNARKWLDKYELVAPFDWTVRKIDFKVWDNLTADEQKYIYVENPNLIEISATLDQLDIVKVSIGQKAKIVFDSYPDKEFIWSISEKDSTPAQSSWVTSYTIKITVDKWNSNIYSSMTAKVSIIVEDRQNIIVIPSSYIETAAGVTWVVVKENWSEKTKEVETWVTDDVNIEIIDWLNIWDIIIKKVTSTLKTWTSWLLPAWWAPRWTGWGWGGWWWRNFGG